MNIGLIPAPLRRDSGYRDYSDVDVNRLRFIANARDLGFSIEEIGELLELWSDEHRASAEVKALALAKADELGRKVEALAAMRASLVHLARTCHGNDRPQCPTLCHVPGPGLRLLPMPHVKAACIVLAALTSCHTMEVEGYVGDFGQRVFAEYR